MCSHPILSRFPFFRVAAMKSKWESSHDVARNCQHQHHLYHSHQHPVNHLNKILCEVVYVRETRIVSLHIPKQDHWRVTAPPPASS